MGKLPSWVLTLGLGLLPSLGAGLAFLLTYEHRMTAVEVSIAETDKNLARHEEADDAALRNVWFAINWNHAEAQGKRP